jgi:biopolymer transport protein ExbB
MAHLSLMIVTVTMMTAAAAAQTPAAPQQAIERSALDHFLIDGGPIAYFLVVLSILTIALVIEHLITIRRGTLLPDSLKLAVGELMQERKYKEVVQTTANDPSLLGGVLHAGLSHANNGLPAMERAMEEVMESRAASLFRRIEYLNIIGNVSPMIGLFGTVYGMIDTFSKIVAVGGQPNPQDLADGISIALVTTFWGLLVAIPALSVFHVMRNRIDGLLAQCAVEAETLLYVFKPLARGSLTPVKPAAAKSPAAAKTADMLGTTQASEA